MENQSTLIYPHLDLETMFDFLEGKLSPGRTAEVEAHVLECAACATALEEMDRAGGGTPENRRQAQEFKAVFTADLDKMARPPKAGWNWNRVIQVAAIALLVLNLGWAGFNLSRSLSPGFSPYPYSNDRAGSNNISEAESDLQTALFAYRDHHYGAAATQLQALPDDPATIERKLFYLGNALLALNRNAEAVVPLRKLVDNPDYELYAQSAQHYLGIAYLRLSQTDGPGE
ncbi:MAG: zf-HC2 domain-containing protein [Bacteroidota bacterium]